ncbi:MAG: ankyrin repeat domain-containing protein [Spirochaetaceae bacterium]|nr:MAG: ankyrin repeat domain-containing protein [Spirochaetaceae bacterium]
MKRHRALACFRASCIVMSVTALLALRYPPPADAQVKRSQEAITLLQSAAASDIATHHHQIRAAMQRDAFGWTPLMIAAAANPDPAVTSALLDRGEVIDARSLDGWTALMFAAAFNSQPQVTRALLEAGADLRQRSRDAWSALFGAARYSGENLRFDGLEAVPDTSRLEVATGEARGWTALFMAARFNTEPQVTQALLAAGADPEARDEHGRNALYYARRHNPDPRVARLLQSVSGAH